MFAAGMAIAVLPCLFGLIALEVARGKRTALDRHLILALRSSADSRRPIGPAWVQEAARDVTSLGSIIVVLITTTAIAGYLFLAQKTGLAWLILLSVAMLSATAYLTIGALLSRAAPSATLSLYFMSFAVFLTVIVGFSRIYLGVHYPTDVLAGCSVGGLWGILCSLLMAWLQVQGPVR